MKAIDRKLLRDITRLRGAVFTIALVVAAGIAAYVTVRGTWLSIALARDRYYSAERFGTLFASLERAPLSVQKRLEELPFITHVYCRITGMGRVLIASLEEPAQARFLSLPEDGKPPLNGVKLVAGRLPMTGHDDEALVLELFAEKHKLVPGQSLDVVMEGRQRTLRIVGIAMSPELVLAIPNGGSAPSPERFAVFWMARPALEAAYDMRGAFNDVVLRMAPGTVLQEAVRKVDALLDPYGGLGSYGRNRQISDYFLSQDLGQLKTMATIAPAIFLAVAAFLLNVVLARLIELDRPQIATLKAVGYSDWDVGFHYLQLTLLISVLGGGMGVLAGRWLGRGMTAMYTKFYRIPDLSFELHPRLILGAALVSVVAGVVGAALSVQRVVTLPPAEAMRPASPPIYRSGRFGGVFAELLGGSARMVAREILRRPARALLSALGIAAATGIVVVGQYFSDAIGYLVNRYMQEQERESLAVSFVSEVSEPTVHALATLPFVRDVQWQTTLQVRAQVGHRERIVPLVMHASRHSQRPLLDEDAREQKLPAGAVLLTSMLAKVLHVASGEEISVTPMQGDRTTRRLRVDGTVDELMGLWIHMPADDAFRWLGDAPYVNQAQLMVDGDALDQVQDALNDMPQVASVVRKERMVEEFRKQTSDTMGTFSMVLTIFAVIIAISVVYNNARIAVSMRSRELASLRVLGFTRGEISSILISELFVQVILGIPLGLVFGRYLARFMMSANDPETFRFPLHISGHSYAVAALVVLLAALASALLVRRKLDRLDLVEVLKTRE